MYLFVKIPNWICIFADQQQINMSRDQKLKEDWERLIKILSDRFNDGDELQLDAVIYLIGIQELGQGAREFQKDEKLNLMHIAICRLLEPYGYYEFDFYDDDQWPHYKTIEELPSLKTGEQAILMKEAIVTYFRGKDIL